MKFINNSIIAVYLHSLKLIMYIDSVLFMVLSIIYLLCSLLVPLIKVSINVNYVELGFFTQESDI